MPKIAFTEAVWGEFELFSAALRASKAGYRGFLKWGYPQIIHFRLGCSLFNHLFGGYPHLWKHPNMSNQNTARGTRCHPPSILQFDGEPRLCAIVKLKLQVNPLHWEWMWYDVMAPVFRFRTQNDQYRIYLVVHPTDRKWVSSPQLQVHIAPTYPIYNQGCNLATNP